MRGRPGEWGGRDAAFAVKDEGAAGDGGGNARGFANAFAAGADLVKDDAVEVFAGENFRKVAEDAFGELGEAAADVRGGGEAGEFRIAGDDLVPGACGEFWSCDG